MRRLAVTVTALVAVVETYRRGYTAPLMFGCRQWCRARPNPSEFEADVVA